MQNNESKIKCGYKSPFPLSESGQDYNKLPTNISSIRQHPKNSRQDSNNQGSTNSDAIFLGWQKTSSGKVFALYNITVASHPLYNSTVSAETLRKFNLKIPSTPSQRRSSKNIS